MKLFTNKVDTLLNKENNLDSTSNNMGKCQLNNYKLCFSIINNLKMETKNKFYKKFVMAGYWVQFQNALTANKVI
jgi:hypothetical protein